MATRHPRILGAGYALPASVRKNDDPIFDWLNQHPPSESPFTGYDERRVLADGENLVDIMVPAAQQALQAASLKPADVDLLLGCGSVSQYWNPNDLSLVHQRLGLSKSTWVVALNNEFSNYSAALYFADGLVRAGRVKYPLIVVGGNWTRYVDYRTPQAISAADGAGAAVMGLSDDENRFRVLDQETLTASDCFGVMFMSGDPQINPEGRTWSGPYFHITAAGNQAYTEFGANKAPMVVKNLLNKHDIRNDAFALIAHQASQKLFDAWRAALDIQPAQLLQTIKTFANMTVASNAVNLAYSSTQGSIPYQHLVLLSLGTDLHANGLLLSKGG